MYHTICLGALGKWLRSTRLAIFCVKDNCNPCILVCSSWLQSEKCLKNHEDTSSVDYRLNLLMSYDDFSLLLGCSHAKSLVLHGLIHKGLKAFRRNAKATLLSMHPWICPSGTAACLLLKLAAIQLITKITVGFCMSWVCVLEISNREVCTSYSKIVSTNVVHPWKWHYVQWRHPSSFPRHELIIFSLKMAPSFFCQSNSSTD